MVSFEEFLSMLRERLSDPNAELDAGLGRVMNTMYWHQCRKLRALFEKIGPEGNEPHEGINGYTINETFQLLYKVYKREVHLDCVWTPIAVGDLIGTKYGDVGMIVGFTKAGSARIKLFEKEGLTYRPALSVYKVVRVPLE